jgi:hypothetical protein
MSSIGLWSHGIMQHAGEAEFALFWPELDWLALNLVASSRNDHRQLKLMWMDPHFWRPRNLVAVHPVREYPFAMLVQTKAALVALVSVTKEGYSTLVSHNI